MADDELTLHSCDKLLASTSEMASNNLTVMGDNQLIASNDDKHTLSMMIHDSIEGDEFQLPRNSASNDDEHSATMDLDAVDPSGMHLVPEISCDDGEHSSPVINAHTSDNSGMQLVRYQPYLPAFEYIFGQHEQDDAAGHDEELGDTVVADAEGVAADAGAMDCLGRTAGALSATPEITYIERDGALTAGHATPSTPTSTTTPSPVKRGKMPVNRLASNSIDKNSPEALRQLILQALAESDTRMLSLVGVQQYIENIPEYQYDSHIWMRVVNDMLHEYDFPTIPVLIQRTLHFKLMRDVEPGSVPFDPTPHHNGHFNCMKLPLRLRLKIYRHALSLPTTNGWQVDDHYTENAAKVYKESKAHGESLHLRTAVGAGNFTLKSPPLQTWMALLSVSKKVFSEAMPIFYLHNTFHLPSPLTLYNWLKQMPTRRAFVGRVILHYDPPLYDSKCSQAFGLLCETNLKFLKLEIDEIDVMNRGNGYGNVSRLPGFYKLETMRGLDQLAFSGRSYEKTKKFLSKMLREKPKPEGGVKTPKGMKAKVLGIVDMEEREEEKWEEAMKDFIELTKKAIKEQRKERIKEANRQKRDANDREKEKERDKKKREREAKKQKRDDEKKAEKEKREAEREAKKTEREAERNSKAGEREQKRQETLEEKKRENAEKELLRDNKQKAMFKKQHLKAKANQLLKQKPGKRARENETDESEQEAPPPSKRVKAIVAGRSKDGVRGGRAGRVGAQVGRANRLVGVTALTNHTKPFSTEYTTEDEGDDCEDDKGHPVLEADMSEEE